MPQSDYFAIEQQLNLTIQKGEFKMMTRSRKLNFFFTTFLFAFVLAMAAFAPGAHSTDVVLVANPKVADSSLSADQIKAVFLGQMSTWPSGAKIEFVTLKNSSSIHEDFLNKYVERSAAQFSNYWKRQVFTGKGRMPKQFDTEGKLIEYVSSTEGALGYISSGASKGSAKLISIK